MVAVTTLDDWMAAACDELGIAGAIDPGDIADAVLDLARAVAHAVERPAAPLTTFLLGVAAGRTAEPGQAALAFAAALESRLEGRRLGT